MKFRSCQSSSVYIFIGINNFHCFQSLLRIQYIDIFKLLVFQATDSDSTRFCRRRTKLPFVFCSRASASLLATASPIVSTRRITWRRSPAPRRTSVVSHTGTSTHSTASAEVTNMPKGGGGGGGGGARQAGEIDKSMRYSWHRRLRYSPTRTRCRQLN